jgi:outer membrane protein
LKALAARQVTRQFRSAFFPTLAVNVMSVGTADENTRLGAIGGLNNPSIFDRNAEGLVLSQLITDFGRTANLTGSAKLRAQAEADNAQATREQILLAVDASFYAAQQAQSVTRVAEQTVATRQLFLEQVSAKASSKLASELDVSFAKVNVDDAKLLLSKAQNDLLAEFARLANLMGLREPKTYRLVEEPSPPTLSTNVPELVEQALQARPELLSLRNSREASLKFARAEKALHYPTISAVGSAGVIPIGDPQLPQS